MASDGFSPIRFDSPHNRHSNSSVKLGLWVLIILGLLVFASSLLGKLGFKNIDLPNFGNHSSGNIIPPSPQLEKIVTEGLKDIPGDFAIYIEDMNSQEGYGLRATEKFPSASLYKLFVMAAVLKEVEAGNLQLTDNLSASKAHLEDVLGGEEFGYEDVDDPISYSVDEALSRVGRISDNFAALMLAEKIGWDKAQGIANSIGAKNTLIKSPITTTAQDMGIYFKLLYQNQLVSPTVSGQIKDYLMLSQLNDRIPAKLPDGTIIVHKTGELSRVRHDAGIVYLTDKEATSSARAYVVVLMSQNLKYEDEGIDTFADLSLAIYNYFSKKIY